MLTGWFISGSQLLEGRSSVVAVAETLVEMGRRFEDESILNRAIAEYKFLRREYPGSKFAPTDYSR